ncbi:MAG: cadherin domain-containing protein, partial [Planctomycetales bacterium]|nr:cadherin domain-containing protein [Planctomycetales bacterium]
RDVDERVNLPPVVAPQSFVVDENSGKGRLVGTVQASDPEATPLTYSILSGNSNNAFTIDRSSGVIRVQNTAALDHEARSLYQLTVQVADSSGLSSRATMTVHVDDVNEAPVVANQTFSMPAGVPVGYVVGSVAASDPDQGDVLTYTVTGGSVLGNGVVVNSRTGVITVSAPWPAGSVLPVITVRVSDQAGLSSSAWLTISVDAASDNSSETLVSHFAFDEGRGRSTYDQNNRRAQLDRPRWTTGVEGRGLRFDGRNDWVTVPDDDSLDLTRGMTMSMWVNPAKLGDWRTGILKERPGGLAYALYVSDDKSLPGVYINLGGWDLNATANQSLPLDTWSHLAATYDGSQLKLFVNGKQVAQLAARGSLVTSNSPLRFGGNSVWGEYFQGEMDEVRLYNSALSAADIARLAGSASSGSATAMRQQVQAVSAAVYSPQLSSTSAGSWGAAATSSLASNRGELLTTLADELRGSGATETQSAVRDRLVENWATATTRTEALAAVDAVLADASEDGARGRGGLESLDAFWERWR